MQKNIYIDISLEFYELSTGVILIHVISILLKLINNINWGKCNVLMVEIPTAWTTHMPRRSVTSGGRCRIIVFYFAEMSRLRAACWMDVVISPVGPSLPTPLR